MSLNQISKTKYLRVNTSAIGSFTLISLIAVMLIASLILISPRTVQAQTALPPADKAATFLAFTDSTANAAGTEVIWTIEWSSTNCIAPIGGVLHKPDGTSNYQALGSTGSQPGNLLITHNSIDRTSETAVGNIDPCLYSLKVTSSLDCTFNVSLGMTGGGVSEGVMIPGVANNIITVTKSSEVGVSLPSSGSAGLQGNTGVSDVDYFKRDKTTTGTRDNFPSEIASLEPVVQGELALSSTPTTPIPLPTGASIHTADITATDCDAPLASPGIRLHSAEPAGSLELAANINPVSGCSPSGSNDQGEQSVRPGTSNELETISLDANCRYTLTVGHAVSQTLDESNGRLVLCEARAWAYQVTTAATPAAALGAGLSDADVGDDAHELSFTRSGNNIFLDDSTNHFVRLTLYISSNCPTYGQFSLAYNVLSSTEAPLHRTPVSPTIAPTGDSPDVCSATPALVEIRGRNEVVDFDGTAVTGSTVNSNSANVGIVVRSREGRGCQYEIQYPLVSGALQLVFEHGGRADDPLTSEDEFSTPDNAFDGRITVSAITLNTNTYTFTYVTRALPITVAMQFPDEAVFTTSEQVDFLISVVGACSRFAPILGRVLGDTGTFRSPQAYPGSILFFDRALEAFESQSNQDNDILYTQAPVVIVGENTFPCSVQVEELSTPAGCELLGANPRTLTYAANLEGFDFNFEHVCSNR